jgi:hypothetical protein
MSPLENFSLPEVVERNDKNDLLSQKPFDPINQRLE